LERVRPYLKDQRFNSFRRAQWAYWTGRLAAARGDYASARIEFARAIEIFGKEPQKIALNVRALVALAQSQQALGDTTAATTSVDQALALAESFIEEGSPSYLVGHSLAARGDLQLAVGASDAARASFKKALEHLNTTLGADHPATKAALKKANS